MFILHSSQKLPLIRKITRKKHLFQVLIVKTFLIEQIFFFKGLNVVRVYYEKYQTPVLFGSTPQTHKFIIKYYM